MSTRVELIGRWQSQLAESERLLFEGSPQLRWLRQMHVRLYRFLLSCYGHGDWRSDDPSDFGNEPPGPVATTAVFVDPSVHHGKQPKSADRIRATLKKVHVANAGRDKPGPLVHGLNNADWITVASLTSHYSPQGCLRLLKSHDIPAHLVWHGDDVLVQVPMGERQAAAAILESQREKLRTKTRICTTSLAIERFFAGLMAGFLAGPMLTFFLAHALYAIFKFSDAPLFGIFFLGWLVCTLGGGVILVLLKARVW